MAVIGVLLGMAGFAVAAWFAYAMTAKVTFEWIAAEGPWVPVAVWSIRVWLFLTMLVGATMPVMFVAGAIARI